EAVRRGRLLLRNQMEWGPRLGRRGRGRLALVGPRRRGLHPALSRATRAPTLAGGHAGRRRADGRAWRAAAPAEPVAASLPDRCVEDPPGGPVVSGAVRGLRLALPRRPVPAAGATAAAAGTPGRGVRARGAVPGGLWSAGVVGAGTAFYQAVVASGHEGVVAKSLAATYRPGNRSPAWRKIKPPPARTRRRPAL